MVAHEIAPARRQQPWLFWHQDIYSLAIGAEASRRLPAPLAALARRNETGQGDHIDLAMLDVQSAFLANQAMNWLVSGNAPKRGRNRHPNIQPQDVFGTRDGHMVLVVGNDGQFAKTCEVLGRPQWVKDDRFAKNAGRVRNRAQQVAVKPLVAALGGEVFLNRPSGQVHEAADQRFDVFARTQRAECLVATRARLEIVDGAGLAVSCLFLIPGVGPVGGQ